MSGQPVSAPATTIELARLSALRGYHVLNSEPEAAFDQLTTLAAYVCQMPIALISLVDGDRLWFKSRLGVLVTSTERAVAFCDHTLRCGELLAVPDARVDPRFADSPMVISAGIRSYAGAPLVTPDGTVIGTLCVLDTVERQLTDEQLDLLTALAQQTMALLEQRQQSAALVTELAQREIAQQQSDATRRVLEAVLDHTDVMIYAKDRDGRYLLANRAFSRLAGVDAGAILGRTDIDLFPPKAAESYRRHDQQVLSSGVQDVFEERAVHPDGSMRSSLSTKFPLVDDGGAVYAVGGISTDVSDLLAARQSAAESEQRWRALVEHSPVSVAVYTVDDLRFVFANPAAAAIYGVDSSSDLIGQSQLDVVAPHVRPSYRDNLSGILAGKAVRGLESEMHGFDGNIKQVEVYSAAVTFDGRPAVQVQLRDITARKAAQDELRHSEARFRALFAGAPVGGFESLSDGTFTEVNPRLCEMLGYPADELVGRTAASIADPAERPRQAAQMRRLVEDGQGYTAQRRFLRKDGSSFLGLVSLDAVRAAGDSVDRYIGMVVDVSEQAAAERALQDAMVRLARQKQFDEAVLESVNAGVLACGADGKVIVRNAAQRRMTGLADGEHLAEDRIDRLRLLRADGTPWPTGRTPLQQALEGADHSDLPLQIGPADGELHQVLLTTRQIFGADGALLGAVAAFTDVTHEREVQDRLRESAAFHDAVLAASPDLIFTADPRTNGTLWSSHSIFDILGYTPQQVAQMGDDALATVVHSDDVVRLLAANSAARDLDDGEVLQIRYRARRASGDYRWMARRVTPFNRDERGEVTQILGIARDITDIVEVEDRLRNIALHDALTGLPNRTLLSDRLRTALARSDRTGQELAVLFCDLDGFKRVNDTGGHAAGDHVLVVSAERLRASMRAEDSVARLGGDEFVVLCETAAGSNIRSDALVIADRIRAELGRPITYEGETYVLSASIGVSFAKPGSDPDDVLRDADAAMYQAKSGGKDRHEVFTGE